MALALALALFARLPPSFLHACFATRAVLAVIAEHAAADAVAAFIALTPARWRKLWPQSVWAKTPVDGDHRAGLSHMMAQQSREPGGAVTTRFTTAARLIPDKA